MAKVLISIPDDLYGQIKKHSNWDRYRDAVRDRDRVKLCNAVKAGILLPDNALNMAIDTVKCEEMLEDRTKKCRKFEADYEKRLKSDMVTMLTDIQLEIEELRLDRPLISRGYECYGFEDKTPTEIKQECSDVIQQKINELKENDKE